MRTEILNQIEKERERQDLKWGGPAHDDRHDERDWLHYLEHQLFGYVRASTIWEGRARLLKLAALTVAVIESIDRQEKK